MGASSVRLVVTANIQGSQTSLLTSGAGNWYAQLGSVEDWMDSNKNYNLAQSLVDEEDDDKGF